MSQGRVEIVYKSPHDLIPYAKNPVIHSQASVEELGRHILAAKKFDQPIVLDKHGVIIKGHRRRLAAIWAKLAEVPTIVRDDLSEEECIAIRLGDNKLTDDREYDKSLLKFELDTLQRREFNLELTGFKLAEIEGLNAEMDSEVSGASAGDGAESGGDSSEVEESSQGSEAKTQFIVCAHCDTEEEMKELFEELRDRQYECKLIT